MRRPDIRIDIQVLRGFAVGTVLIYHAASDLLPGGFLGVDVFFVISGFLMGGILAKGINSGELTLLGFYLRRARRLLPAAYTTFAICAVVAPWTLTSLENTDFQKQLLGAITFTSNIVLWRQSGYFAQAAALKPLLHTWSLAIEEQYYIFLPAFFMFTPRKYCATILLLVTVASIGIYFYFMSVSPNAAFFLLPTRVWELLFGSIGALIYCERSKAIAARLFWPAVAALAWLTLFPIPAGNAAWNSVIICAGTLVIILANHERAARGQFIRAAAWLGDVSYPLYLIHWPVLSFMRSVWLLPPPQYVLLLAMTACAPVAWGMVKFVEEPIRGWLETRTKVIQSTCLLLPAFCLAVIVLPIHARQTEVYLARREVNHGLSDACEYSQAFEPISQCVIGPAPKLLLWGDSFAMHLAQALKNDKRLSFAQATMSACAPLLDLALLDPANSGHTLKWSEACTRFNRSVVEYLARTPSIEVVVLSSAFNGLLEEAGTTRVLSDGSIEPPSIALTQKHFMKTISNLRGLGKRILIVAPFPSAQFDVSVCLERVERKLPTIGNDKECLINLTKFHEESNNKFILLNMIRNQSSIPIFYPEMELCNSQFCATRLDGVALYRDKAHLSIEGSAALGRRLGFSDLTWRLAH